MDASIRPQLACAFYSLHLHSRVKMAGASCYKPLPSSHHIRLLNVVVIGDEESGTDIFCKLTNHDLTHDTQPYHALSYVWGSETREKTIVCNGTPTKVPKSAFEAILGLNTSLCGSPMWIDSICIDQSSLAEKVSQIRLMDGIFRHAASVKIWLGPEADKSDLAMEHIAMLAHKLPSMSNSPANYDYLNHKYGLPDANDPSWAAVGHLYMRPWFGRLWTLQEAVLARSCTVHCGLWMADWADIVRVGIDLERLDLIWLVVPRGTLMHPGIDGFAAVSTVSWAQNLIKTSGQIPNANLIMISGRKTCTLPRDRIFAVLSLSSKTLQETNSISYDLPIRDLYIRYGKACLKEDSSLAYLGLAVQKRNRYMLPTWCVNLDNLPLPFSPFEDSLSAGQRTDANNSEKIWPTVSFFADSDDISIEGFEADHIVEIVRPDFSWEWSSMDSHSSMIENVLNWKRACETLATEAATNADERDAAIYAYICTITAWIPTAEDDFESFYSTYADHMRFLQRTLDHKGTLRWVPPDQGDRINLFQAFSERFFKICGGRTFFWTVKGRLGIGVHGAEPGDLIAIFYGGKATFVLREATASTPGGSEAFELVGDAFVHGLMELDNIPVEDIGPTKTFRIT